MKQQAEKHTYKFTRIKRSRLAINRSRLGEINEEFREAAAAMMLLTDPRNGLLTSKKSLAYCKWKEFEEGLSTNFSTLFTIEWGADLLCWEILVERGLSSINRELRKDLDYAHCEQCESWLRDILWIIAGDTDEIMIIKPLEFCVRTKVRLIKLFTETFVLWCKLRNKFNQDFFRAIARGRFNEDKEAWALLKKKVLEQIARPLVRRVSKTRKF